LILQYTCWFDGGVLAVAGRSKRHSSMERSGFKISPLEAHQMYQMLKKIREYVNVYD
jgi:hypothetical protein